LLQAQGSMVKGSPACSLSAGGHAGTLQVHFEYGAGAGSTFTTSGSIEKLQPSPSSRSQGNTMVCTLGVNESP